jgi:hypothetical protein
LDQRLEQQLEQQLEQRLEQQLEQHQEQQLEQQLEEHQEQQLERPAPLVFLLAHREFRSLHIRKHQSTGQGTHIGREGRPRYNQLPARVHKLLRVDLERQRWLLY